MKKIALLVCSILWITNIHGQNEKWLKLDVFKAVFYTDLAVAFELKGPKSGFETQLTYITTSSSVRDKNNSALIIPPSCVFDETNLELAFTYRRYITVFGKSNRFYVGAVNFNSFNLSIEEGYEEKFEENFPDREPRIGKKATQINVGPAIGFLIKISDRFRLDMGLEIGIDLARQFGPDKFRDYNGWIPFKISYRL